MAYRRKQYLKEYDYTLRMIECNEDPRTFLSRTINLFRKDPMKFFKRKLHINNKDRKTIKFNPNRMQKLIYTNYIKPKLPTKDYEGEPVRLYILKGRQLGCSTLVQGLLYWFTTLYCNVRAFTVAHNKEKAAEIFGMSKLFHSAQSRDFRPTFRRSNKLELLFANPRDDDEEVELGLQSWIKVQSIDDEHLGAGSTLHALHLSEFARYENINKNALPTIATLRQAVPRLPLTFIFLETTAYGEGYAKDVWDDPNNGYDKVFISWISDPDYTCTVAIDPESIRTDSEGPYGNEEEADELITEQLLEWYPEFTKEDCQNESLYRLAWRRLRIDEDFHGDVKLFNQDYPLTPEEAFLTSGRRIFSSVAINEMKQFSSKEEIECYKFLGNDVYQDVTPGAFEQSNYGPLQIREEAIEGKRYVVSADVGNGLPGSDFSVAHVLDSTGKEVALFRDRLEPDEFGDVVFTLALIYNKAFIIPEANVSGQTLISRITKHYNYGNLYLREVFDKLNRTHIKAYGFFTGPKTRQLVLDMLRPAIRERTLDLFSEQTFKELLDFQEIRGKMQAPGGEDKFDDCVMSLALANRGLEFITSKEVESEYHIQEGRLPFAMFEELLQTNEDQQAFFGG